MKLVGALICVAPVGWKGLWVMEIEPLYIRWMQVYNDFKIRKESERYTDEREDSVPGCGK